MIKSFPQEALTPERALDLESESWALDPVSPCHRCVTLDEALNLILFLTYKKRQRQALLTP